MSILSLNVKAQIINTFAGCGVIGAPIGDGGQAILANTSLPAAGCFDASGSYYFFHNINAPRVRKVDTAGIITTVAGNGIAGYSGDSGLAISAKIDPQGIFVDSAGNIYIADYYNRRLRKVDAATGIITTIAGNGTNTATGDGGLAINATTVPIDVCVDKYGNIFIAENGGGIRKIDTSGIINTIINISGNMCFDLSGHLIISALTRICKADTATGIVDTIAGTGIAQYNGDNMPALLTNLRARDVAIDDTGNIYFADDANDRIRKIDLNGIVRTVVGTGIQGYSGDGGLADTAELYNPEGIVFDRCGNLYIADDQNGRIRKVTFHPDCSPVDTTDTTTAIYNITSTSSISIYPNPAKEQITITGSCNVQEVMILNTIGQVLITQKNYSTKAVIDVSALGTGIYFIKIVDRSGAETVKRFLKE